MSAETISSTPPRALPFRRRLFALIRVEGALLARSLLSWIIALCVGGVMVLAVVSSVTAETSSKVFLPVLVLDSGHTVASRFWFQVVDLASLMFPFLAFLFGYGVLIDDRERGNLSCLGSLPVTRRDIYLSKVITRIAAFASMICIGVAVGGIGLLLTGSQFGVGSFLVAGTLTIGYGITLLSPAIALSALVSTRNQGLIGVIGGGFALLFTPALLLSQKSWLIIVHPLQAYSRFLISLFDGMYSPVAFLPPQLLSLPLAAVVVLGWIILPTIVGFLQFRNEVFE
ncbi:ABC transporter permease subunit [Halogeometricum borinquense]|uniref:ABC transporter permease subunit n=1 Tax=Halogeometricum borinquense TaxID=60847 RepID=UPI001EF8CA22|nr:ABC transporter permease subunit [Halogeometricum borinquense]